MLSYWGPYSASVWPRKFCKKNPFTWKCVSGSANWAQPQWWWGTFVITARLIRENNALPPLNFSWTCLQRSNEVPACAFDPGVVKALPVILRKLQGESRGVHMAVSCTPRVSATRTKHTVAISGATVPCKKWLICCGMLFLFHSPPMCDRAAGGSAWPDVGGVCQGGTGAGLVMCFYWSTPLFGNRS